MRPEPEPTAPILARELRDLARDVGLRRPGLAKAMLVRAAVLTMAPATVGGCSWLADQGDEVAEVAEEFYARSRSGTRAVRR